MHFVDLRIASFILSALTLGAAPLEAVNGDYVGRVDLGACGVSVGGVTFDGTSLYYSLRFDPVRSTFYRVNPKTGQPEGSVTVKQSGIPLANWLGGLEYDSNRAAMWVGYGNHVYLVSLSTGEVLMDIDTPTSPGAGGVAYDPWNDVVYKTDNVQTETQGFYPNPRYGDFAGGHNLDGTPYGLTFDGTDFWFSTGQVLPPPYPNAPGLLCPTTGNFQPDPARAFAQPDKNSRDLAFDCVTFPVPVVWAGNGNACEIRAYEVAPSGPCLGPPDRRLLRLRMADLLPESRVGKLPLVTATAERLYRAARPLDFHDAKEGILSDARYPLVYYSLVGPNDEDQGDALQMVKDRAADGVVGKE